MITLYFNVSKEPFLRRKAAAFVETHVNFNQSSYLKQQKDSKHKTLA